MGDEVGARECLDKMANFLERLKDTTITMRDGKGVNPGLAYE